MTFSEPTGSSEALRPDDAGPQPLMTPGVPEPISQAGQLLAAPPSDRRALAARLAWGFAGLTALGSGPQAALALVEAVHIGDRGVWGWIGGALALPIAAALTVSLPLPGLWILLGMQDDRADPRACFHALSLAYYRIGLMALGLAPILVLYACTGARHGVLVGAGGGYFVGGGVALALLLGDLHRCLPKGRATSRLLLFGWACFVCLLAVYFFVKLEPFGR
ncbi:MAG TPA: hypothetical protein VI197_09380 [Polyangiaceae bacterium]